MCFGHNQVFQQIEQVSAQDEGECQGGRGVKGGLEEWKLMVRLRSKKDRSFSRSGRTGPSARIFLILYDVTLRIIAI